MIVIEMDAGIDAAGTVETFYVSTDPFVTSPTDTPAHTAFLPRLIDPGSIGVSAYSSTTSTTSNSGTNGTNAVLGPTGGGTTLQSGELSLANADGLLDGWLNYGFDGRRVVIRIGEPGSPYPGGFTQIFQGTIDSLDADWETLILKLRDKQYLFSPSMLTNLYLGNNALPAGVEGTPADLLGQPKPKIFGTVYNMSPLLVNTSKLTYQVNDGPIAAISAVYDRGSVLLLGSDYATAALLQASTVAPGGYNTCIAQGYFQLNSNPSGTVTADVVQGTLAQQTVAQVLRTITLAAGLTTAEISAADVTALDTLNSAPVGVFVSGTDTFLSVMDQIAQSIGAWYGFDTLGVLRMGVLSNPTGAPKLSLFDYNFNQNIERRAANDNNIPAWKVMLNYAKNWTVQTDLAGIVGAARVAYLAQGFRSVTQTLPSVLLQYKLATEMDVDTLLINQSDATAEGNRQLALQSVRRDIFDVTIPVAQLPTLIFLDVVQLTVNRFGLASGKMFRLIGITYQLNNSTVTLSMWG